MYVVTLSPGLDHGYLMAVSLYIKYPHLVPPSLLLALGEQNQYPPQLRHPGP